jgi:hypothetical protein
MRQAVLDANATVCCVCKTRGIGINIHHIDGDPENNLFANLAVLCVQDHDAHHRPYASPALQHLDLGEDRIREYKKRWEHFLQEARARPARASATLNAFGHETLIHSLCLTLQDTAGHIELERTYHILDKPLDRAIDDVFDELSWLGSSIPILLVDAPLPVEHCPGCHRGLSYVVDPPMRLQHLVSDWARASTAVVYLNPRRPSLGIVVSYQANVVFEMAAHLCRDGLGWQKQSLAIDDTRTTGSSWHEPLSLVRSWRGQVSRRVRAHLQAISAGHVFIGTDDPDASMLIDELELPVVWRNAQLRTVWARGLGAKSETGRNCGEVR